MIFDEEYKTRTATKQVTDNLLFNLPGAVFPDETNDYFYDDFVNLFNTAIEEKKKQNAGKSNNYKSAYYSLLYLMKEFQSYLSNRSGAASIASQSAKEAGERAAAAAKAKIEESKARGEAEARAAKEASAKESVRIIEEKTAKVKAGQEPETSKYIELTYKDGVDDTRDAAEKSTWAAIYELQSKGYTVQIDPETGAYEIVKKNSSSKLVLLGVLGVIAYLLLSKKKAGK